MVLYRQNRQGARAEVKIYLETTVFNYYFDERREGHADVVRLFDAINAGAHEAYTSEYVEIELKLAPEPKRSDMLALIEQFDIHVFPTDDETRRMAGLYIAGGALTQNSLLDSQHIAVASVQRIDYVVSYNYRHINKAKTKLLTGRINNMEGYGSPVICTAKEVLEDE